MAAQPKKLLALPPILLCGLLVVVLSPQPGLAEQPTHLTFAWPAGATAEVSYSVEGWRQSGTSRTTLQRQMKYRLRVSARNGEPGMVVERLWPTVPAPRRPTSGQQKSFFGSLPRPTNSAVQALVDDLPELVERLEIAADGRLLSVDGGKDLETRIANALADSEADAGTRLQIESLTTDESLFQLSKQAWAALVTAWLDRDLAQGFPFSDRSDAETPSVSKTVEVPASGRFAGWVPCDEDERASGESSCVELHWSAAPQGEDAKEAVEALERRSLQGLELTREVTVVADPATLLPYSTIDHLEAKRTLQQGSETIESSESMTRRRRFIWTHP
ncbi:MAG: hypothetical protein AAF604_14700 [Acidobacteriota bacterium]